MPVANAAATHLVCSPSMGRPALVGLPPMGTTAAMSRLMTVKVDDSDGGGRAASRSCRQRAQLSGAA